MNRADLIMDIVRMLNLTDDRGLDFVWRILRSYLDTKGAKS